MMDVWGIIPPACNFTLLFVTPSQVIMRMMDVCGSVDLVAAWSKKMAPPLVTLLGAEPEVQYVALRNINLIVQKRPAILANEVKVCETTSTLAVLQLDVNV